jgi:hypothetical protein
MPNWKGIELHCKTRDLIAQDRAGTPRDDGFHRNRRGAFMRCAESVRDSLRKINGLLGALTKGGES